MLRKILSLFALSLGVLSIAAGSVAATGYQLDNVNDSNVTPGQPVQINANGFGPNTMASITFLSDPVLLKTVTTNAQGVVRTEVVIPADAAFGAHKIVVAGVDRDGNTKTVTFDIVVSATGTDTGGSPGGGLPSTGSEVALLISVGGLAVAGGWALLGAARRRQAA